MQLNDTSLVGGSTIATAQSKHSTTKSPGGVASRGGRTGDLASESLPRSRVSGTPSGGTAGAGGAGAKDQAAYVVARHVADFGNVVLGFSKTKAFRVANTGKVGGTYDNARSFMISGRSDMPGFRGSGLGFTNVISTASCSRSCTATLNRIANYWLSI